MTAPAEAPFRRWTCRHPGCTTTTETRGPTPPRDWAWLGQVRCPLHAKGRKQPRPEQLRASSERKRTPRRDSEAWAKVEAALRADSQAADALIAGAAHTDKRAVAGVRTVLEAEGAIPTHARLRASDGRLMPRPKRRGTTS